uniref:PR domain zinc finger protein 8 n=1 Tax=Naja naja TaxID=35670 RepID=A0A8C7E5S7_NAJNA
MDESGVPRSIWDGDAKAVQQCLTDIFTSVYTTCDIPENAIFGPCVLSHTSLYDSIAFVALKSTDKRTVPYIFRVDTSATNGSSEGLMWLRLVQSARDKEEQNLEAYIKNGQLFYRSLRRIAKDEELLVWYGKDLTELLLLSPARSQSKMKASSPHTCLDCGQRFQFEFPYVAHLRFRCPKRLPGADSSPAEDPNPKNSSPKEHEGARGAGLHPQQQYRPAGSYYGLDDASRLYRPPSPDTELGGGRGCGGGGGGRGPPPAPTAFGSDAAAALLHLALPAGSELVRQVQRLFPHDVRPGVPHALPPQEGVRAGAAGEEAARGEAQVPHLQRVLPRAPPPLAAHDVAQLNTHTHTHTHPALLRLHPGSSHPTPKPSHAHKHTRRRPFASAAGALALFCKDCGRARVGRDGTAWGFLQGVGRKDGGFPQGGSRLIEKVWCKGAQRVGKKDSV